LATQPGLAINHHSIPPHQAMGATIWRARPILWQNALRVWTSVRLSLALACSAVAATAAQPHARTRSTPGRPSGESTIPPGQQLGPTAGEFQSFPKRRAEKYQSTWEESIPHALLPVPNQARQIHQCTRDHTYSRTSLHAWKLGWCSRSHRDKTLRYPIRSQPRHLMQPHLLGNDSKGQT
jgi:hypothetical protein